ncbi:MAG: hypothetical protein H6713_13115 [Myxococcales bacterium]|nr:hypothetical protein [Myxococcales bacterium]MCB9750921.1 hypothetical protein [Myxococcales bacterium]
MLGPRKHLLWLVGVLSVTGCIREPLEVTCLEDGALVVTELRLAKQGGSFSEWVELYNPTDAAVPLAGVTIAVTAEDDFRPEERRLLILAKDDGGLRELGPGEYAVVGEYTPDSKFLSFHYNRDVVVGADEDGEPIREAHKRVVRGDGELASELLVLPEDDEEPAVGALALESCGAEIQRLEYALPRLGTLALDGALDPDGDHGAAEATPGGAWCVDTRGEDGPAGVRGTPGEANLPCDALAGDGSTTDTADTSGGVEP